MLANLPCKVVFDGDGETVFFTFDIPHTDISEMKVKIEDPDRNITVPTVTWISDTQVRYPVDPFGAALPDDYKLVVYREVALTQATDLANQGTFAAETLEDAFDKLTMLVQEHAETLARCLQYPITTSPASIDIEAVIAQLTAIQDAVGVLATAAAESVQSAEDAATAAAASAGDAADALAAVQSVYHRGTTAPAAPNPGDQWFKTDASPEGALRIYHSDGIWRTPAGAPIE